jgi:glucan phosphoethanolaminetransferase (alkaline phosphatase superfamily)
LYEVSEEGGQRRAIAPGERQQGHYSIAAESQTYVPMVMWFGPGAYKNWGIDQGCMQGKLADSELSHDNVFYSLLGFFLVPGTVYQPQLDMFGSCRPAAVELAKLNN